MPCRHSRSSTGRGPGAFSGQGGSSGLISAHKSSSTIHGRVLTLSRTAESSHQSRPTRALQQDRVMSSLGTGKGFFRDTARPVHPAGRAAVRRVRFSVRLAASVAVFALTAAAALLGLALLPLVLDRVGDLGGPEHGCPAHRAPPGRARCRTGPAASYWLRGRLLTRSPLRKLSRTCSTRSRASRPPGSPSLPVTT